MLGFDFFVCFSKKLVEESELDPGETTNIPLLIPPHATDSEKI